MSEQESKREGPAETFDRSERVCIVGAGSSGLAVGRRFLARGIGFDCLEREDDVGGNWYFGKPNSRIYRSTRLISSKRGTEYPDFRMPPDWPEHPAHGQVWQYLRSYADHFDLRRHIEFETPVERIEAGGTGPAEANEGGALAERGWIVTLRTGERRRYGAVVVANGHNWDPRWPEYPGRFGGRVIHSAEYKSPDPFRDQRVLVVGGGNSGFDIAVDVAGAGAQVAHSMRRAYHVLPRFFQGTPIDQYGAWMYRWRLPLWIRRMATARTARLVWREVLGSLPRPDHRLFETHPVINSRWPHEVARGRIEVKPDVRSLSEGEVEFADGTRAQFDAIIYATGYKLSFPFLDRKYLNWREDRPRLYLNIFHPERDDLFVAGLIQPNSGQFGLADYQARLIAAYVSALREGSAAAEEFRRVKRDSEAPVSGAIRYVRTERHLVEVDRHTYVRELRRALAALS